MKVHVVLPDASFYAATLSPQFPEHEFSWATEFDAAEDHLWSADALVTTGVGLTARIVEKMQRLQWVHSIISGTDQFAEMLSARPDLLLTSSRGIHGTQMAEMAVLHMLALSRQVVTLEAHRRRHLWDDGPEQRVLEGKTVVIVGLGVAGRRLGLICKAFDMTVYGVSRSPDPVPGFARIVGREALREIAPEADFLILALPNSPETRHIVDTEVLRVMRPDAFLVNIARGGVLDEQALVETLRAGGIRGAGLDVAAVEPLPEDSPLWDMDNVFLTPHLAGRSDRYQERALAVLEANLRSYGAGRLEDLINVVPIAVQ